MERAFELLTQTPSALADALMRDVYYPFSVCAYLDEEGRISAIRQFDTLWSAPPQEDAPDAARIWLISNHDTGDMRPMEQDLRHACSLRAREKAAQVQLFIYAADEGMIEICDF